MKNIAVLIETSTGWGSGMVHGVSSYLDGCGENWNVFLEPRGKFEPLRLPKGWRGDGVIARVNNAELADEILQAGLPCVNVSWYEYGQGTIARCTLDEEESGRLAAKYYLEKKYAHFAYCGSPWRPNYDDLFGRAYSQALNAAGYDCHHYPASGIDREQPWINQLRQLGDWLTKLPKPCGVLAIDTQTSRQLIDAAKLADLGVPETIAVLAGEYDELASRITRPKLSMLDNAAHSVGYHAAELLDRMLKGEAGGGELVTIKPTNVISEKSTDWTVLPDERLVRALRFVRDNFHRPIQVADLAEQAGTSRRLLEKLFDRHLNVTPSRQISLVRLEEAKHLLDRSVLPMSEIAARCGFDSPEVMCRVFQREAKTSPSEYRRTRRGA
ncbi:AraC family transcriptional regulator [Blastopirellula retiformator]|uniref:Xylose operon regulatory protein n=1 Tax=Blastopirellula retiformator TaxID=2527970 RepID=A0A5C5V2Y1_9BACT|nr:DNA-binding transcriptional regulator [Blastopirellula retiformator]TWT32878.1 Xylose operon regulatory protein [Blastopirellula retiformator]